MVRQYIARYVENYFRHELTVLNQVVLLFVLAIMLAVVSISVFAFQFGLTMFMHIIVNFYFLTWFVFYLAAAFSLAFFIYVLLRGLYEMIMYLVFSFGGDFPWHAKISMTFVFIIDFMLSDFVVFCGGLMLTYVYLATAINTSFSLFYILIFAFILMYTGLLMQVVFVNNYRNTKYFSQVISLSKQFIITSPRGTKKSERKKSR